MSRIKRRISFPTVFCILFFAVAIVSGNTVYYKLKNIPCSGINEASEDKQNDPMLILVNRTHKIRITNGTLNYRDDASWLAYCEKNGLSNSEYTAQRFENDFQRSVIHYSDELRTLFDVMQFRYVTDELVYYIYINNQCFVVPPEYSDIAERVYNSAEKNSGYPEGTNLYYGIGAVNEKINTHAAA